MHTYYCGYICATLQLWIVYLYFNGRFVDTMTIVQPCGYANDCHWCTVYPKKYAHGFVVLCFVVVMQSFIMNSHEVFIHIHQGCFAGTGAIVRLTQCQWSKPDGYGNISQCITTTKHSKAKTVCIFPGIYCSSRKLVQLSLCYMFSIVNKILAPEQYRWIHLVINPNKT